MSDTRTPRNPGQLADYFAKKLSELEKDQVHIHAMSAADEARLTAKIAAYADAEATTRKMLDEFIYQMGVTIPYDFHALDKTLGRSGEDA